MIIDEVDLGDISLPAFQRGYVWNRDQKHELTDSLHRKHPVGNLPVWGPRTGHTKTRG